MLPSSNLWNRCTLASAFQRSLFSAVSLSTHFHSQLRRGKPVVINWVILFHTHTWRRSQKVSSPSFGIFSEDRQMGSHSRSSYYPSWRGSFGGRGDISGFSSLTWSDVWVTPDEKDPVWFKIKKEGTLSIVFILLLTTTMTESVDVLPSFVLRAFHVFYFYNLPYIHLLERRPCWSDP